MRVLVVASAVVHLALIGILLGDTRLSVMLLCAFAANHVVLAWGVIHPRSRLFGPVRHRLTTTKRVVALTFDDGPHPLVTPRVLDILRARSVHATFFLVGKWVELYPGIVRRIVEEGHTVGNHSFTHSYLFWTSSPHRLAREIRKAQRTIESVTQTPCQWFRAPVGMKNCYLRGVLERQGLVLVSWDARFLGRRPFQAERLARRLRRKLVPGSILMLHDGHDRRPEGNPAIIETLPVLLDALEASGYRSVPLA